MLYLLWALLNVALSIFFIAICFKATKLVREKFGMLSSLVFVLGLLSFMRSSNDSQPSTSSQLKVWSLTSNNNSNQIATLSNFTVLEKTWISRYGLRVKFYKDVKEQLFTPVDASFSTSGFVSGTYWKPLNIQVNKTENNHEFEYFITCNVDWKFLGFTVYSQFKEYRGILSV